MTTTVMLKKNWPGQFGRTVFDENGKPVKRLVFNPGEITQVNDTELAAITPDLGTAIWLMALDKTANGIRYKPTDDPEQARVPEAVAPVSPEPSAPQPAADPTPMSAASAASSASSDGSEPGAPLSAGGSTASASGGGDAQNTGRRSRR